MSPQQFSRTKAIFTAAIDLPAADRAAYIRQACGGDPELERRILALVAQHDDSDDSNILPTPPLHSIERGELVGGRFRILAFAGRGGMGEVYAAEDLELGSRVALKTLRPDLLDDPEFLGRFRREVQLARQVTHPNICRIFDVGRDNTSGRERVYLTMEYLDGQTLGEYLQATGKLGREAAVPLMKQMADGLTALHEHGIVHRDFKPGNVMVVRSATGSARAVVSDFGLARALEAETVTNLSRAGQLMGTPDYMAPEQLLGQPVTPAADIYAFGMIMYEMVTGRKVFPGGRALENAVQRVVERPTPPRQQCPEVTAELEEIILRCLAREPQARPTAFDVAQALAGITPLPQRRDALGWRMKARWVAVGLVLMALAVAGLRLSGWGGFSKAPQFEHIALLPLTVLSDEADLRVFGLGLMETITARLSQYDGQGAQLLVVPASEVRSQEARNASDARRKFGVSAAVEGTIQSQGDRVRLLLTLIDTKAMRQVESVVVEDQRANAVRLQDAAVNKLANILKLRLQPKYAREQQEFNQLAPGAYEYYLQGRGYLQRSDQTQSLDSAITMFERALSADAKFAPAHSGLGEAYLSKYNLTNEPALMEKALASAARGLELNPGVPETHISMGRVHIGTGRYAEGRQDFERAIEIDGRNNEAYQGLAIAYSNLREFGLAEATYQKAIGLRPGDWTGYKQLGLYYIQRRELDKAAVQFRRVVDLSPDNAQAYVNLGAVYSLRGDLAEAERTYLRALDLDPKRLSTLANLGKVYLERGSFERAVEMYGRALQISTRSHLLWGNLGMAHFYAGNRAKAEEALVKATELLESELLVNPKRAETQSRLGFYWAYLGRKDFEVPLRRALELAPENTDVIVRVAEAYAHAGRKDVALDYARQALAAGYPVASLKRSLQLKNLAGAAARADAQ